MQRIGVSSSNLESVGYEDDASILEVEFKNGSIYQYYDVPRHVFDDLMAAGSHGIYFSREIRNRYSYSKL